MGGRGFPPKPNSRTRHKPLRGEWKASEGVGWQHGAIPEAPDGLHASAMSAWTAWMQSWIAARWAPNDLPGLFVTIQLYDQCERYFDDPYIEKETRKGDTIFVLRPNPASELRQYMDNYGITPRGQQDRRWLSPKAEPETAVVAPQNAPYAGLRVAGSKVA